MSDLAVVLELIRTDATFRRELREHPADAVRRFDLQPADLIVIEQTLDQMPS